MQVEHGGLTFESLGHASVRITTGDGRVIYIDPWSEMLDDEPHDGDVVFVTHDDRDHYDVAAIEAVRAPTGTVAAYDAVDTTELGLDVVDLPYEGTATVAGIDVRTLPAYNDPDGEHVDEDGEPFHADGEVIGLLFTIDGTTVYYPSDTDFHPHQASVETDVFLPPIGGGFTMDRHEAAEFVRSIEPALVLPVHYDTFEAVETDAEAFAAELRADGFAVELF
jgi:L-ascorbate metabolism protein UlaG (beta-lactamase superfamily)